MTLQLRRPMRRKCGQQYESPYAWRRQQECCDQDRKSNAAAKTITGCVRLAFVGARTQALTCKHFPMVPPLLHCPNPLEKPYIHLGKFVTRSSQSERPRTRLSPSEKPNF